MHAPQFSQSRYWPGLERCLFRQRLFGDFQANLRWHENGELCTFLRKMAGMSTLPLCSPASSTILTTPSSRFALRIKRGKPPFVRKSGKHRQLLIFKGFLFQFVSLMPLLCLVSTLSSTCNDPIEVAYYSSERFQLICTHCACVCELVVEGQYPICDFCRQQGLMPIFKRKRKSFSSSN